MTRLLLYFAVCFFNFMLIKLMIITHGVTSKKDSQLYLVLFYWLLSPITILVSVVANAYPLVRYRLVLLKDNTFNNYNFPLKDKLNSLARKIFFS